MNQPNLLPIGKNYRLTLTLETHIEAENHQESAKKAIEYLDAMMQHLVKLMPPDKGISFRKHFTTEAMPEGVILGPILNAIGTQKSK